MALLADKLNNLSYDDDDDDDDDEDDECTSLLDFEKKVYAEREKKEDLESFDYDWFESRVYEQHYFDQTLEMFELFQLKRWILTFFVGLGTALVAIFIEKYTGFFTHVKLSHFHQALIDEMNGDANFGYAFLVYTAISCSYVFIASFCVVFISGAAKGSGITEIKCTLNGIKITELLRLKTLVSKAIGVLFSVAAGLPVGKEGPMIHSGAIVGAGLSQGKSTSLGCDISPKRFRNFRCDKEKRDFISCGAAAGVAAAFGAPIGGVLFALEEGASFWHQTLTWRTFFCAMVSAFALDMFLTYNNEGEEDAQFGMLGTQGGTFGFGKFNGTSTYRADELVIFIAMGIVGGLFGALSNQLNTYITKMRMKYIKNKFLKMLEAIFIAFCMCCIAFWSSYYFGTCFERDGPYSESLVRFYCDSPTQYNDLASLYTVSYSTSTKQLFHFKAAQSFTPLSLILFFLPFYFMACWTYGINVPSGLFVPSLLSGAAYGRICLLVVNWLNIHTSANEGMFPLIGAAAMLGGIARMTISLTVIILECTGVIEWGLPVMLTLMAARWVGNCFNEGIYDIHVHLRHLPFLEFDPPFSAKYLRVQNVMTKEPVCIDHIVKVGKVYDAIKDNLHYSFPVVENGNFAGVILRKQLCTLLDKKDFFLKRPPAYIRKPREGVDYSEPDAKHSLAYLDFNALYPRWPVISEIVIDSSEREQWMDLTPYINPTPHTIQEMTPVPRAFRLFRSLGLRHLVVLNRTNKVVGVVTRKELTAHHFQTCLDSLSDDKRANIKGYWHSFVVRASRVPSNMLSMRFSSRRLNS